MEIEYFDKYECEVLQFYKSYKSSLKGYEHHITTCSCYKYIAGYYIIKPQFDNLIIQLDKVKYNIKYEIDNIMIGKNHMDNLFHTNFILDPIKVFSKQFGTLNGISNLSVTIQRVDHYTLLFRIYDKNTKQYFCKVKRSLTDDQLKHVEDQLI